MRRKSNTSNMNPGCMMLFALPFAAVGVGAAVWLVWGIIDSQRMQSWEETPARIVRAELEVNHGDDSTTYKATAEYVYQYGGREYTSTRVSVSGGSDNIGSYQQDIHRQLEKHQKSGRPFRCFVNPDDPAEAILFRELRWEMVLFKAIFALAFGTAGFGMLAFGIIASRKHRASKKLAAVHPDEPWLHRADWAAGRIKSSNKIMVAVAWAIAVFWNAISSSLIFVFVDQKKDDPLLYLFLLFPLVGVGMIAWAIVATLRYVKYGEAAFQMASTPGVIGGQLAGVIYISAKVQPEDGFRLKLSCVRSAQKNEVTEWQDDQVIVRQLQDNDPERSAVPVLFNIPYDCQPAAETPPIRWQLAIAAGSFHAKFDVPVFKTPESDPNFEPDRSAIEQYALPEDSEEGYRRSGVIKTESPFGAGVHFEFPRLRFPSLCLFSFLFWAVWTGVIVLMIHMQAPILFPIFFGLFDVLIFIYLIDSIFYSSAVDVTPLGVEVSSGRFFRGRSELIEKQDIEKITVTANERMGNRVFHAVKLVRRNGKKVTLGKRIEGKQAAEAIVDQIEQALDMEADGE